MKHLLCPIAYVVLTILPLSSQPRVAAQKCPREVLKQFCELDSAGKQLTSSGWPEVADLFVRYNAPRSGKVYVVKGVGVGDAKITGNRAELWVEYLYLGELDSAARWSNLRFPELSDAALPGQLEVRAQYDLILTDKHWEIGSDGKPLREISGPSKWRIERPVPEPRVAVQTAVAYITHLRDETTSPVIKKNATRSIAALKRLLK